MEPETPSRRKKSGEKPVTIDLEAVPATAGEDTPSAQTAASETTGETTVESIEHPQDIPAGETPDDRAQASAKSHAAESTAPVQQKSNASAFAAGVVGGLIALLGAGSLQYGGYLPALGPDNGNDGAVAALSDEVETLKTRLADIPTPAPAVDLQPLETRLAELEQAAQAAPQNETGVTPEAISTLESALTGLSADLAALREEVQRTAQAGATAQTLLTERLAAAEEKLDEPRGDVEVARAVAASALKTAIDRGGPYLAELEAFASIVPDDPSVPGLREHAALGVPSRSDLVRDFSRTADRILDAVHQPDGDQGIIDRLMASAASAIRVRPVGSIEGSTPEAIVARIENKLQNGDFKGAQIEWQTLPETGQAAAADYKSVLDQRVAVEELIGSAVSGAIAGTANQG